MGKNFQNLQNEMFLITQNEKIQFTEEKWLSLLEYERNDGRDKSCKFEDYLIKKYQTCYWQLKNDFQIEEHNLDFLKKKDKIICQGWNKNTWRT